MTRISSWDDVVFVHFACSEYAATFQFVIVASSFPSFPSFPFSFIVLSLRLKWVSESSLWYMDFLWLPKLTMLCLWFLTGYTPMLLTMLCLWFLTGYTPMLLTTQASGTANHPYRDSKMLLLRALWYVSKMICA
jgi:hypothetical protein